MLSREDVLEELELLPVWRLRNPSVVAKVSAIPAVVEGAVQIEPVQIEQVPAVTVDVEPVQEAPAIEPTFRMIVSDDGQWVFVMTPDPAPEVETLLQNMLKAVSVKPKQDVADANRSLLDQKIPLGRFMFSKINNC